MTRQEAEAQVRAAVILRCRGPYLLSESERSGFAEQWQALVAAGDFLAAVELKDRVELALGMKPTPVNEGDWDNVFRAVAGLVYAHTENCGNDFNDIVCAGPFDGQEHEYACPKCGVTGTYRAPYFDIE